MPIYHTLGTIPRKRHIVFRQPDGALLRRGTDRQQGLRRVPRRSSTTCSSRRRSSRVACWRRSTGAPSQTRVPPPALQHGTTASRAALTLDRVPLLFNADVAMSIVAADRDDDDFYRNAQGDEVIYVSDGAGVLETQLGRDRFRRGDYLVIPRGIVYRCALHRTPGAAAW